MNEKMNGYINYIKNAVVYKDYLICAPKEMNHIFSINFIDGVVEKEIELPLSKTGTVKKVFLYNDKILCSTNKGNDVFITDYAMKTTQLCQGNNDTVWQDIAMFDNEIFFLPRYLNDGIWAFSVNENSFYSKDIVSRKIRQIAEAAIARRIYIKGKKVYFIVTDRKMVIEYDAQEEKVSKLDIPTIYEYYDMAQLENDIYFITRGGEKKLIRWNTETNRTSEIYGEGKGEYSKLVQINEGIILLSKESNTEGIEILDSSNKIRMIDVGANNQIKSYYYALPWQKNYLIVPWSGDLFILIDEKGEIKETKRIKVSKEFYFDNKIVTEGAYGLSDFIEYI